MNDDRDDRDDRGSSGRLPTDLGPVRFFFLTLGALLVGYMFLGRGFAHVGVRPVFVGEVVLVIGLIVTVFAVIRLRLRPRIPLTVWLLLAFMVWGAIRTIPFLPTYGVDALRDGVLWGYGLFALMIFLLADRWLALRAFTAYGWIVPIFALWVPISWNLFRLLSSAIDPTRPGDVVPLIFFKSGDMAVHITGSLAFLILGTAVTAVAASFAWRALVAIPLGWTLLATSTSNRGAMVSSAIGLGLIALLTQRPRRWLPVLAGGLIAVAIFALPSLPRDVGGPVATPAPTPTVRPTGTEQPSRTPRPTPTPVAVPGDDEGGRQVGVGQLFENVGSIFGSTGNAGLDGTRQFRLQWWAEIVDYTVFGPHFWTGKGFGVNLADDDGFQPTADRSLRAPHNSHMTALARMGVPGFVLWGLLQGAFGIGLLRSVLAHRRADRGALAVVGSWVLVYWAAIMVNTSVDPYIEGPQGGIWFWSIFGLGLVVMRLGNVRSR